MSNFDGRNPVSPLHDRFRFIDQHCDRYETEWRAGREPRITDFLGDTRDETRVALWLQLVLLDHELREGRGEMPTLADYRESCPDRAVFLDLSTDEFDPVVAPDTETKLPARPELEAPPEPDPRLTLGIEGIAERLARPASRALDSEKTSAESSDLATDANGPPSTVGPPRDGQIEGLDGLARARAGTAFGEYVLLEKLGAGGMGVVFKARHRGLNRLVAIKMIKTGVLADDRHIRLFRAEAESVAALDHPHIVPVLDSGEHEGLLYYTMKLVDGRDLSQLRGKYRDRPADIARLVAVIAAAIEHAHQRGVLHRDLKPSNVLIDTQGAPHVIDFGLAMRLDASAVETATGNPVGTPSFMSPEQARGHRDQITTATDVYGLGTLLYTLLTGHAPFSGTSAVEILQHVLKDEPPRPRLWYPTVDRDLETICLKCLAREPKHRYHSAREVADDLNRWLDGRPIVARPASRVEHAVKWVRRRKLLAALFTTAVIGSMLGVAGLAWGWTAALAARDEARAGEDAARRFAYAASINLADRDWRDAHVTQVLRDLDETRPPQGKSDLRGFEWYYFDHLCHAQQRVLKGDNNFSSVAYGAGGKLLAGADWDGSITLWDTTTGRVVRRMKGDTPVRVVAFHPSGKTIASGDNGAIVTIWDVATGQPILKLTGHKGPVVQLTYTRDGLVLASSGLPGEKLLVWDPDTGRRVHDKDIPAVAFVLGGSDKEDQTLIAISQDEKTLQAWDIKTGNPAAAVLDAGPGGISAIATTRDRKLLAVAHEDGTIHVLELATHRLVQSLRDQRNPIQSDFLEFSDDGRSLASAGLRSPAVLVWDVSSGHLMRTLQGRTITPQGIALCSDGVHLACAGNDATIQVWDMTHDPESRSLNEPGHVYSIAFAPDSSYLAAALVDGTVVLHDAVSGQVTRKLEGHKGAVLSVAIDRDGRRAATGGYDHTVRIWDLATGRQLHRMEGHGDAIHVVAFSADGKTVASASRDRTARLWDVETGREVHKLEGHISPVWSLAFAPDGQSLATGGADDFILIWDAKTGRQRSAIPAASKGVHTLAIDPSGRWIASGGEDDTIKLWALADGRLIRTLTGHSSDPSELQFSPGGGRLISASNDRTVRVWDPVSGRGLLVLRGHTGLILGLACSPDGRRIASAGEDGRVRLWEADAAPEPNAAR